MELAKIFSNHMVFQAEKPMRFFGTGKGEIEICFEGKCYQNNFDTERWVFELPAHAYGGPFEISISLAWETTVLKDIWFGDLFLCAGQSNVQFLVKEEKNKQIQNCNPLLRYFVSDRVENYEGFKSKDGWQVCKENGVGGWSALGYHIAEKYAKKKGVPVGVVGCFQGASVIRSWLPERVLDESVFVELEKRHGDSVAESWSAWNKDCVLYERTFSPLIPFAFKSVVWYQGESDTTVDESRVYTELLARLIGSWREDLRDHDLPFVVVEICDYDTRNDDGWHAIQRCQQEVVNCVKGVTTVTSKDVCEHFDIHPSDKEALAEKIVQVL